MQPVKDLLPGPPGSDVCVPAAPLKGVPGVHMHLSAHLWVCAIHSSCRMEERVESGRGVTKRKDLQPHQGCRTEQPTTENVKGSLMGQEMSLCRAEQSREGLLPARLPEVQGGPLLGPDLAEEDRKSVV